MKISKTKKSLKEVLGECRMSGKTIGFVPTMGALHDGHLSLVDIAKERADLVVVSIFVNPAQFAEGEDFDKYPRDVDADVKKLEARGVDVVYLPGVDEIYPDGFDLKISTGNIGQQLEGVARPHFFDGVAMVVTKLFMQVRPDVAVFGSKDFQQLHIVRKLVVGLDIDVDIIGAPIVREDDGLAMSSRNVYLPDDKRKIAAGLYKVLGEVAQKISDGEDINAALQYGKDELVKNGFDRVDYLEFRDVGSLSADVKGDGQLLVAAYLGGVRLLDNLAVVSG